MSDNIWTRYLIKYFFFFKFPSSITHSLLSPITIWSWQVAAFTRCRREISRYLVSPGAPPLQSFWTATSIWSKARFTSLEISVQISTLKVLRLPVRSLLGLEASRALIYNGYIQRHPPPPQRDMNLIQTYPQVLLVRNKFRCASRIGTYKLYVFSRDAFSFCRQRIAATCESGR